MRTLLRRSSWALAPALPLLLAACGTVPSDVAMPRANPNPSTDTRLQGRDRYLVQGRALDDDKLPGLLRLETTRERVLVQIEAHSVAWQLQARELSAGIDQLSNTQFGGAVLAGLGAIASSLDAAKAGAAVAGGAGLWSDHFKLAKQAENYRFAAEAMDCAWREVSLVPASYWDLSYAADGTMKLPQEAYASAPPAPEDIDNYTTQRELFATLHRAVYDIRRRLVKAQTTLAIAVPSSDDIRKALTATKQAEEQGAKADQRSEAVAADKKLRQREAREAKLAVQRARSEVDRLQQRTNQKTRAATEAGTPREGGPAPDEQAKAKAKADGEATEARRQLQAARQRLQDAERAAEKDAPTDPQVDQAQRAAAIPKAAALALPAKLDACSKLIGG